MEKRYCIKRQQATEVRVDFMYRLDTQNRFLQQEQLVLKQAELMVLVNGERHSLLKERVLSKECDSIFTVDNFAVATQKDTLKVGVRVHTLLHCRGEQERELKWKLEELGYELLGQTGPTGSVGVVGEAMTLQEAVGRACEKPTLVEALTYICVLESERVVKQARANPQWETCFMQCIKPVLEVWGANREVGKMSTLNATATVR